MRLCHVLDMIGKESVSLRVCMVKNVKNDRCWTLVLYGVSLERFVIGAFCSSFRLVWRILCVLSGKIA